MTAKLIRLTKVQEKTGLSRTSIWRAERVGTFPKRRRLGPNSVAWIEAEIDTWINSRTPISQRTTLVTVGTAGERKSGAA
jgi:prophage regulatory protein